MSGEHRGGSEHPAEHPLCGASPRLQRGHRAQIPLLDTPALSPQHTDLHLHSGAGNIDTPTFFSFLFVIIK